MKSRATTYILIAGFVVVWGIILWKILGPENEPTETLASFHATEKAIVIDTLMLDYRDPFLSTPDTEPATEIPSTITRVAPPSTEEAPIAEHRLRYLGSISRGGVRHGIVEINGIMHTIARGDTADGYRLETLWQDSVRLLWKSESVVAKL